MKPDLYPESLLLDTVIVSHHSLRVSLRRYHPVVAPTKDAGQDQGLNAGELTVTG